MARYAEAREVWQTLLPIARKLDDPETLAYLYGNLAVACQELGDLDEALPLFREALALHDALGNSIERTRNEWNLALLLIRQNKTSEGIRRLREVMKAFADKGSVSDAGLVALDLAEQLVTTGAFDEVLAICDDLGTRFAQAGMPAAAAAMKFVRSAAAEGAASTVRAVHHVRGYVERLSSEPQLLFLAPPGEL
jgi:tetratricopeptide (TPR) repeat protein